MLEIALWKEVNEFCSAEAARFENVAGDAQKRATCRTRG